MEDATTSTIRARWGGAVTSGRTGFTAVPDILIRSQAKLRLSTVELVVILNIVMHWWDPDEWPYPRTTAISERMGVTHRTVQRAFESLESKGLVRRLPSQSINDGPIVRPFDLHGLRRALEELAAEERAPG